MRAALGLLLGCTVPTQPSWEVFAPFATCLHNFGHLAWHPLHQLVDAGLLHLTPSLIDGPLPATPGPRVVPPEILVQPCPADLNGIQVPALWWKALQHWQSQMGYACF